MARQRALSTTERGYGSAHQRERAKWKRVVEAGQANCWRCGAWLDPSQPFDLGHDDIDRSIYRGPECRPCNRAAGARASNQRRGQRRREQHMTTQQEITTWPAAAVQIDQARQNTWLATAAHDDDGMTVVKLWPPLPGTDVAATVSEELHGWRTQAVGVNPRSPSATLLEPLKGAGIRLQHADGVGMATAQGRFADLLNADRLSIIGRPELTEAARLAEVRRTAGSYAIDVYAGVEPLVACQLAVWTLGDDQLDYDISKSFG